MEQTLKLLDKYGISAALLFAVIWMNARVSDVEERLFDCYEKRVLTSMSNLDADISTDDRKIYAVLPNEIRIRRNDKTNKG